MFDNLRTFFGTGYFIGTGIENSFDGATHYYKKRTAERTAAIAVATRDTEEAAEASSTMSTVKPKSACASAASWRARPWSSPKLTRRTRLLRVQVKRAVPVHLSLRSFAVGSSR